MRECVVCGVGVRRVSRASVLRWSAWPRRVIGARVSGARTRRVSAHALPAQAMRLTANTKENRDCRRATIPGGSRRYQPWIG